jgi:uncharacterized membrane protein YedE/YeeE
MTAAALNQLTHTVAWLGFGLAFIFGAVANRANFCTMGAISDVVNMGSWTRMRMWLLAIAVAIIGAQSLQWLGYIDLSKSIYQTPKLIWFSHILGGILFGIGMVLSSGCASKNLIRLGAGNLKSIVVLLFVAVSAYITLRGLFAIWRTNYIDVLFVDLRHFGLAQQDLSSLIANFFNWDLQYSQITVPVIIAMGLLIFIFSSRDFWKVEYIFSAIVIGLIVVAGWYVSAHIGFIAEHPDTLSAAFAATNTGRAESFSFVAPSAYTLELLMFWGDSSKIVTFGIAGVLGVIAGSFTYAIFSKTFYWEAFNSSLDIAHHIIGSVLMGFGGITALGCTIGQGISGFSTLALGSILTFLAMALGAVIGLKYQYSRIKA